MIPNIIYAIKCKDGFQNKFENKTLELFEQISRFGSFGFMVINVLYFGFWFDKDLAIKCVEDFMNQEVKRGNFTKIKLKNDILYKGTLPQSVDNIETVILEVD